MASAQRQATSLYPDLGKAGSPINTRFLALYQEARQSNSLLLSQPDWPLVLARQAASALIAEQSPKDAPPQSSINNLGTTTGTGSQAGSPSAPALTPTEVQATPDLTNLKGLQKKVPISVRYATKMDGYFKGPFGKKLFKFYNEQRSIVDVPDKGLFQKCAEAVGWTSNETMTVYCPETWKGSEKLGVYISVNASNGPLDPREGYSDVMDGLNMIYVAPTGTSNAQADMRRMALALDALATIRKTYPVDESRIFVGGLSGGGAISAEMATIYPEFRGAICQVRNFYLGDSFCSPFVGQGDIPGIARRKQAYAFVTAPGDMNYEAIKKSMPAWKTYHVAATVIENDLRGHTPASANALKQALDWAIEHSQPPHTH